MEWVAVVIAGFAFISGVMTGWAMGYTHAHKEINALLLKTFPEILGKKVSK